MGVRRRGQAHLQAPAFSYFPVCCRAGWEAAREPTAPALPQWQLKSQEEAVP